VIAGTAEAERFAGLPTQRGGQRSGASRRGGLLGLIASAERGGRKLERSPASVEIDRRVLREVLDIVWQLPRRRVEEKAKLILEKFERHQRIVAFDDRVITKRSLAAALRWARVEMICAFDATMDQGARRALDEFAPAARVRKPTVLLTGHGLAEGVGLHGASCLVNLTNPTTLGVLEQRCGRIVRLGSPHEEVEVLFAREPEELRLGADAKLNRRAAISRALIGASPLPAAVAGELGISGITDDSEALDDDAFDRPAEVIGRYQSTGGPDFFASVRSLRDGPGALVDQDVYGRIRQVSERLGARVSLTPSRAGFVFVSLKGTPTRAPAWLLFEGRSGSRQPLVDHDAVCLRLRESLAGLDLTKGLPPDEAFVGEVEGAEALLGLHHQALLSVRTRRALQQMDDFMQPWCSDLFGCPADIRPQLTDLLCALRDPFRGSAVNADHVAAAWLELIAPERAEAERGWRSRRPFTFLAASKALSRRRWTGADARHLLAAVSGATPPAQRVSVILVGVGAVAPLPLKVSAKGKQRG